jgi:hypothetical protein
VTAQFEKDRNPISALVNLKYDVQNEVTGCVGTEEYLRLVTTQSGFAPSCTAGFSLIGTGMPQSSSFCISNEDVRRPYVDLIETCSKIGARLCSAQDLLRACRAWENVETPTFDEIRDVVADSAHYFYNAIAVGTEATDWGTGYSFSQSPDSISDSANSGQIAARRHDGSSSQCKSAGYVKDVRNSNAGRCCILLNSS